ncbi:MAG: HPr kinase/phosphatase C-terminal domain-containing protein [Alphaproteobacteria bacterium]|nr:HPr kinase/phosphatase C-terminal domain-containing protein [Alphaproteobacteria bacterium]
MQPRRPVLLHATAVALPVDAGWAGVLLRGTPGSGKSDLALRLIDQGARLIADDQTELCPTDAALMLRAPARTAGRLEVRGLGLVPVATVDQAPLVLAADLVDAASIERLPPPRSVTLAGYRIAAVQLAPFEASAAVKLRLAVGAACAGSLGDLDKMAAS